MAPGALPTFLSSCFCSLWLFLLRSSGWTLLVYLGWRCIYHHIRLPMILIGMSTFFGKIWIYLASLLIPGSCSVSICVDSIVLTSVSLGFISLFIITRTIVGVACLARCIFALESGISSMVVLVGLCGVWIWSIKLILGLLILILLSIAPNRHSHTFSLPPILFCNMLPLDVPLSLLSRFSSLEWNFSRNSSSITFFLESLDCFVLRQVFLVATEWRSWSQSSVPNVSLRCSSIL